MVYKIALTGGPCAGKTSALKEISVFLNNKGYETVIVPETATELINSGITSSKIGQRNFQKNLLELQIKKEQIYLNCAGQLSENAVVIFDRGCLDGKAYLNDSEYDSILEELQLNEKDILSFYDAVIFLDSAAMSDDKLYSVTDNNPARIETEEEARIINIRTREVWKNHKSLIIIETENDFQEKILKILSVIENLITNY
ncbi:MAG: ATP-binding protein [Clostridia bacterium]|nr:ATP-binding protein [Clostridia bacterium]